jgi:pimeloyl-ACP methyl ester carboxylesterase
MNTKICFLIPLLLVAACDAGPKVHARVPAQVSPDKTYVFHFSGMEEARALAAKGLEVIVEERLPGQDDDGYSVLIWERMRELLARGVPLQRIGLVGRGAGGRLAMMAAGLAQAPDTGLVAVGACPPEGAAGREDYERILRLHAHGIKSRFLSLIPKDGAGAGSCAEAFRVANGAHTWEAAIDATAWAAETADWMLSVKR